MASSAPNQEATSPSPLEGDLQTPDSSRLAKLVELPVSSSSALALATGHTATVSAAEPDKLVVRGPKGEVQLSIRFTPAGPVLTFAAAAIDLQSTGAVSIDCARLDVRAREAIDLRSGGDLAQTAAGVATLDAREVAVQAHTGELTLDAKGDVDVHGARILLNS